MILLSLLTNKCSCKRLQEHFLLPAHWYVFPEQGILTYCLSIFTILFSETECIYG